MNPPFKPLEESLEKLMGYVENRNRKKFKSESENFYTLLGRLSGYKWMGTRATEMVRQYQTRYDQIKLLMGARR